MSGVYSLPAVRLMFALAAAPGIIFLVHVAAARLRPRASRQLVALQAALAGAVPVAALAWQVSLRDLPAKEAVPAGLYAVIVYGGLANTYFHLFNMSETARRIRILYEVYRAGTLSPEEFESLYKTTGIIGVRLGRLIAMKQLRLEDGRYAVRGKTMLRAAQAVVAWRRLLGLQRKGA